MLHSASLAVLICMQVDPQLLFYFRALVPLQGLFNSVLYGFPIAIRLLVPKKNLLLGTLNQTEV
jgi:hypothetical protein